MGTSRPSAAAILTGAVALGAVAGLAPLAITPAGRSDIAATTGRLAVASGVKRQREPKWGDSWRGCNDARAAGTVPIYRGEPGYRPEMDGDNDGIACEPRRYRSFDDDF